MKLSRIYIDFISSLKIFFRGRSSFFWVLAFPIILMLIFGAIFSGGNVQYELAVQNKDGSDISFAFINAVNSTNAFKVHMVNASENADAYIKSNRISGMLIVPQGFGNQVQHNLALGATRPSTAVQVNPTTTSATNASALNATRVSSSSSQAQSNNTNATPAAVILKVDQSSTSAPVISGVLSSIANGFNSQLTGSTQIVGVENQQVLSSQFKYIDFFVPGIIGLTVLTTGVLGTVGTNTQYRNNGILRKLATTPLGKSEWIISKMLYQTVVIFISAGLIIVVAKLVYNVTVVPNVVTLLLLFVGTICFTGIGMIIARFVKDEDAANAAASAVTFPMLFLAGTFIPLETMPDYLQTIAKFLPLTYLNYGLRDAMILGDTASALYNMAIVLIAGAIFFVIGSIITDWREGG
ncbi:MAG: ABC transporter permease [Euryarchaeota archaeon]|nr:ABC transporter permease [Euryarchaeota archaeon]